MRRENSDFAPSRGTYHDTGRVGDKWVANPELSRILQLFDVRILRGTDWMLNIELRQQTETQFKIELELFEL